MLGSELLEPYTSTSDPDMVLSPPDTSLAHARASTKRGKKRHATKHRRSTPCSGSPTAPIDVKVPAVRRTQVRKTFEVTSTHVALLPGREKGDVTSSTSAF